MSGGTKSIDETEAAWKRNQRGSSNRWSRSRSKSSGASTRWSASSAARTPPKCSAAPSAPAPNPTLQWARDALQSARSVLPRVFAFFAPIGLELDNVVNSNFNLYLRQSKFFFCNKARTHLHMWIVCGGIAGCTRKRCIYPPRRSDRRA